MLRCGLPGFRAVRSIVTGPYPPVNIPRGPFVDFALENVEQFGDRPALIDGLTGFTVRYSELKTLTRQVASGLAKRGFGQGQTLTIFAANCWESVVAYHAVMTTGAKVNLVNCHSTAFELSSHLRQTRPRFLLVTPDHVDTAMKSAAEMGSVEDIYVVGPSPSSCLSFDLLLQDDGSADPWGSVDIRGDDVALLPHSSGTSGFPKTVMLTHNNLRANLAQGEPVFDFSPGQETFLAVLPFYHVYSPIIVYGFGLRRGASHVILPSFQPETMLKAAERFGVSTMHLVPPLILFLTFSPMVDQFDLSRVAGSFCAAAPLHPDTHQAFLNRFQEWQPEFDLQQGYGMTECSPLTHVTPRRALRPSEKLGTIGVPLPNTECRVVRIGSDEDADPGEEGEIFMRGPQVMKGYLENPKATEELIRDGWVHSGDIGYHDEDGYFFVTDRVKELIKYKGMQVAPAELEALLLLHPGVRDVGVVGRPDDRSGELTTAFVVKQGEVGEEELKTFVSERLSASKHLHGGVVFVDEIPKSASGKILRRILREQLNG